MEMILYSTSEHDNVINKSLTEIQRYTIRFKRDTDIVNPIIPLRVTNGIQHQVNYMEIPELNRKYFIRDVQNISGNIWEFRCECDVLETYKDDILNSNALVLKGIGEGDYQDVSIENEVRKEIEKHVSDIEVTPDNNLILSTVVRNQ